MNMLSSIIFLVGGLLILYKSAELLVAGAVKLARQLGVSPLIIGLTIVAMGTSAPEVAASIAAALKGAGDVAIGNVYGSNIANLALVGGICAMIRPITVRRQITWLQIPIMLGVAVVLWPLLHNLRLGRGEGLLLLVVFSGFLLLTIYKAKKKTNNSTDANEPKKSDYRKNISFIIIGLVGLAFGADITVRGAVFIGKAAGLSDAVIGLTIIAVGTSLPELVTSIVASIKKQDEISIGNLVGSNIFNTLLVVGAAGTIQPFSVSARLIGIDYLIMLVVSALFAGFVILGKNQIKKTTGLVLFFIYIGYIIYLLAYNR
jgi:cation:H+ antiporter